jgi:hypothetical protein
MLRSSQARWSGIGAADPRCRIATPHFSPRPLVELIGLMGGGVLDQPVGGDDDRGAKVDAG